MDVVDIVKSFSYKSDASRIFNNELFLKLLSASSTNANISQDVLFSGILWNSILYNLVSLEPINRKRAIYWLHRNIDRLSLEKIDKLSVDINKERLFLTLKPEIIMDMFILIESLEEKQTHVIVPTLHKIDQLKKCYQEQALSIHWLLIIIEKASLHESTLILKWAFTQFLNLPVSLELQSYRKLLSTFFIKTLNNSNLYFSPDSIDDDKGFFASDLLSNFLDSLFNEFSQPIHRDGLVQFLDLISSVSWNSQALLFLSESFSTVRCLSSSLPLEVLSKIGYLCQSNLATFELKYRQCISSFFLTGFINNYCLEIDQLTDFARIIHVCFDINRTIIPDRILMDLLRSRFDSLSIDCSEMGYQIICDSFDRFDLGDCDFLAFSNKIACVALFLSIICQRLSADRQRTIIGKLLKPIRIKTIVLMKQLHWIDHHDGLNDEFSHQLRSIFDTNINLLMSALEDEMGCDDKLGQTHCIDLMKYFIEYFPHLIIGDRPFKIGSPLAIVISANIHVDYWVNLPTLVHIDWFIDNRCQSMSPLDYEQLQCMSRNLTDIRSIPNDKLVELMHRHLDLLDTSSSAESLIAVLNVIGRSVHETIVHHHERCPQIIDIAIDVVRAAWSRSQEFLTNAGKFWLIYEVLLDEIVQTILLATHDVRCDETRQQLADCVNGLFQSIFDIGENKFGMVHKLGSCLYNCIVTHRLQIDRHESLNQLYLEVISRLVTFGPCHRRSLRFENRIDRYVTGKYGQRWITIGAENGAWRARLAESSDRVAGLLLACIDEESIISTQFRMALVNRLHRMEQELISTSKNCYKNYSNNALHRTRHRILSCVLLCVKMILESNAQQLMDTIDIVEQWMLACIERETLHSVRRLAEWILILIYDKYGPTGRWTRLLDMLRIVNGNRPAHVCSLITIARHLIPSTSPEFINQLMLVIMPLGSAQNYNVRLHAMCFTTIVKELVPSSDFSLQTIIDSCISFIERSCTGRNIDKLRENFWWSVFDPRADLCLETIFSILPKLFELVEEEWISLEQFQQVSTASISYGLSLINCRPQWTTAGCLDNHSNNNTNWRVKVETSAATVAYNDTNVSNSIVDVQKKIQPWLTSRPDEDALRDLCRPMGQGKCDDIILVCSLLDKATNLGGLARTSNIFGVGEFVVDNLRIIDDMNFKQLAVTADKWINMIEVSVRSLVTFIALKRLEGFDIVGVEQTANSVALQSANFKQKTVLILGNEKEGIPTEFISHLDRCIEIPQFGQIRSLNVHVTGAIVLWEYMKQIKLNNNKI